jgi:hypothetical protein
MLPRHVPSICCRALLLLCSLVIGGCGGEKLVKVAGTVTRDGKAVPNLGVHFVPEEGLASHGLTDHNGHFTLLYSTGKEGAVTGKHKVWVQLPPDPQNRRELSRRASEPDMEALLLKYGNSETTPLTVEVKEGQKEIKLTLD